jgi:DNA-binding LacI/PurR family transcriptional regulator
MVTVHDVARLSGVSIATVSRTLREPQVVSAETRERVQAAIDALGYRPNRAARSLRRGRTGVVALVVPDIENPYFAALTKGAQAAARAQGYGLVVVDTAEQADVEAEELTALRSQVDGVILASSRLEDDALLAVVQAVPSVLINRDLGERAPLTPSVTIDERAGVRAAVDHLRGLGHRRLLYVGGPERSWSQGRRLAGIREAVAEAEDTVLVELNGTEPTSAGGRRAAAAVREDGATGVIAYNDVVALGLLAGWAELGVGVPGDISVIGFDNTYVAELSTPGLTSVGVDLRDMGGSAVDLLLARVDRADAHADVRRLIVPTLVHRGSTGARTTAI